jgi:DNA topoisomerase II
MFFNIKLLVSSVAKSGVVNSLLSWADFKQSKELKKTDGIKKEGRSESPVFQN